MYFLVFACVLLAVSTVGAVRAAVREAGFLRARRGGVELQAEVLDIDAKRAPNSGSYFLTPVVRYHLDGHRYEAELVNSSGASGSRGSAMTIVVSPDHPYEPYDRYGGMGGAARGWLMLFALALAVLAMALVAL